MPDKNNWAKRDIIAQCSKRWDSQSYYYWRAQMLFLLLAQLPSDESPTKMGSNLSLTLIPSSQGSSLGVNAWCTNICTCQESPLHFSPLHFSWWGASSRCFCGYYRKCSRGWYVYNTIRHSPSLLPKAKLDGLMLMDNGMKEKRKHI